MTDMELLAALEHEQWVEWSQDLAAKEQLSARRLARWQRLWVPYDELTEEEKEQDRVYARRVIPFIDAARAESEGLRAVVATWGMHRLATNKDMGCAWAQGYTGERAACDCGLDAAMEALAASRSQSGGTGLAGIATPPEGRPEQHGRHCPCTPCKRQDWTAPYLAPCGWHPDGCPDDATPPEGRPDER